MSATSHGSGMKLTATDSKQALIIAATGVLFSTLWSSAFIAGKVGLDAAPPLYLLAVRFLVAGILMISASIAITSWRPYYTDGWRPWLLVLLLGLLNNAAYLGMSFYALQSLPAGLVVLIVSTAPIVTAVMAYFTLGESLTGQKIIGLLVSLAGVGVIMYPRIDRGDFSEILGIILVSISALALASGTVVYKRYAAQIPALWVNAWSTLFGALMLLPVALTLDNITAVKWNATLFGTIGYLVFVVSIGAMLLWFWLIRMAGASKASTLHFLNPPLGLFLAWLLLDEVPTWNELLGVFPVSLGVLLVVRGK